MYNSINYEFNINLKIINIIILIFNKRYLELKYIIA